MIGALAFISFAGILISALLSRAVRNRELPPNMDGVFCVFAGVNFACWFYLFLAVTLWIAGIS